MHGSVLFDRRSTAIDELKSEVEAAGSRGSLTPGGSTGNKFRQSSVTPREAPTETFSLSVDKMAPVSFSSKTDLMKSEFYGDGWIERALEIIFKISERNSTIRLECYCGLIQFSTTFFSIIVTPLLLSKVGYPIQSTTCATCLVSGVGSVLMGVVANLPIIVGPPTSITIFLQAYLINNKSGQAVGNAAVLFSGQFLLLLGYRPFANFVTRIVPKSVQVGTAIGIGLITCLAGVKSIGLIIAGNSEQVSRLGNCSSPEVLITFFGLQIIIVFTKKHHKLALCYSLIFGAFFGWMAEQSWPTQFVDVPTFLSISGVSQTLDSGLSTVLVFDLCFLFVIFLNGLLRNFCEFGKLLKDDNKVPRARWVYFVCGISTIFSACIGGPPMLVSPESLSGIKAGSKTGLSSVVCGLLYFVALFFTPFCSSFPECASAPILIIIGVVMMQNTKKIDWAKYIESVPCFVVLFMIPFTFSIVEGALMGYISLLTSWTLTGKMPSKFLNSIYLAYAPQHSEYLKQSKVLAAIGYVHKTPEEVKGMHAKGRGSCLALQVGGDEKKKEGAVDAEADQIPASTSTTSAPTASPFNPTASSPIHLQRQQRNAIEQGGNEDETGRL